MINLKDNSLFGDYFELIDKNRHHVLHEDREKGMLLERKMWLELIRPKGGSAVVNDCGIIIHGHEETLLGHKDLNIKIATFETKFGVYFQHSYQHKTGGYAAGLSISDHLLAEDKLEAMMCCVNAVGKSISKFSHIVQHHLNTLAQPSLF